MIEHKPRTRIHDWKSCAVCQQLDYAEFRHTCVHEAMAQNDMWLEKYQINSWPRWDFSDKDSTLIFSMDGVPKVICDVQFVGSTANDSWQWVWGNRNYPLAERQRMEAVRDFGELKGWKRLSSLFLENKDIYVGWECTAIANHLLGAMAGYRWPVGGKNEEGNRDFFYVVILASRFSE